MAWSNFRKKDRVCLHRHADVWGREIPNFPNKSQQKRLFILYFRLYLSFTQIHSFVVHKHFVPKLLLFYFQCHVFTEIFDFDVSISVKLCLSYRIWKACISTNYNFIQKTLHLVIIFIFQSWSMILQKVQKRIRILWKILIPIGIIKLYSKKNKAFALIKTKKRSYSNVQINSV